MKQSEKWVLIDNKAVYLGSNWVRLEQPAIDDHSWRTAQWITDDTPSANPFNRLEYITLIWTICTGQEHRSCNFHLIWNIYLLCVFLVINLNGKGDIIKISFKLEIANLCLLHKLFVHKLYLWYQSTYGARDEVG